jgi:putative N-acetylmannosamine-6-phosphate epimerase
MSTIEEVKAAQQRMNEATTALRGYTERPAGAETNIRLHRQLADALKKATDEYVALVADLRA